MLIVHHMRKSAASDEFDRISGKTGIYGCAYGVFVLSKENRTDSAATLINLGRDEPVQRIYMVRDGKHLLGVTTIQMMIIQYGWFRGVGLG